MQFELNALEEEKQAAQIRATELAAQLEALASAKEAGAQPRGQRDEDDQLMAQLAEKDAAVARLQAALVVCWMSLQAVYQASGGGCYSATC